MINFSDNLIIQKPQLLNLNMYDNIIETLMVFFYNRQYVDNLKKDNRFFAVLSFDQTGDIFNRLIRSPP